MDKPTSLLSIVRGIWVDERLTLRDRVVATWSLLTGKVRIRRHEQHHTFR